MKSAQITVVASAADVAGMSIRQGISTPGEHYFAFAQFALWFESREAMERFALAIGAYVESLGKPDGEK